MANEAITLVKNGKPRATVVVARDLGPAGRAAVDDLVRVIATMSGVALPVVGDGDAVAPGAQVHVGRTAYVVEQGIVPAGLPVNGYRIATIHAPSVQRLVIAGSNELGTSHGVYGFLSDELGVMWGMQDPIFEEVPRRDVVEVEWIDRTECPTFGFRVFSGIASDWTRRNRIDDARGALPFYGHGHNLFNVLPPSKFGDHPEYYAMLKGERHVPEKDGHTHIQPCLTNPDVIRIAVEHVRRFFDENPDRTTFSLCPNDSGDFCECPSCLALDEGMERYRGRRMNSDSYFHYITEVANALYETHSDRYVSVYAYWTTELPPRRIERLPRNVVVYLTQDSSQYFDAAYEARDHEMVEIWSRAAHNIALYDYYGLGWYTPRVYSAVIEKTLPWLPTRNVKGYYSESYAYWAHMGSMLYLATRLLWDVNADPRRILDGWYESMFKEAAEPMRRFHEAIERSWMTRPRVGHWFQGLDCWWQQMLQWLPAAREESWAIIEEAYAAATGEVVRARVDYIRRGHRLAYSIHRAWELGRALSPATDGLDDRVREIAGYLREALALFTKDIATDVTYGAAYYRGERAWEQFDWLKTDLARHIEEAYAGRPDALAGLVAIDATLADAFEVASRPKMRERWERQMKREQSMELYK